MIYAETTVVITTRWAAVIAALTLLLLLGVAHILILSAQPTPTNSANPAKASDPVQARRRGIKALVIGADGRASTSKVQAVLWTFAVFYAFAFLLVWGRSRGCPDSSHAGLCAQAATGRAAFATAVNHSLDSAYYVLLGFPLAAAVTAKALTTNKVVTGDLSKPPIGADDHGIIQGLGEVMSNDAGQADLLDFQYFAFNLLTLTFFAVEFLSHPANGLPVLPATLIALSGVSAAAYTTKKALETDVGSAISRVVPNRISRTATTTLTVIGSGFGPAPAAAPAAGTDQPVPASDLRQLLLDGVPIGPVAAMNWQDTRITATLTPAMITALKPADSAKLTVMDLDGAVSAPATVEFYSPAADTG